MLPGCHVCASSYTHIRKRIRMPRLKLSWTRTCMETEVRSSHKFAVAHCCKFGNSGNTLGVSTAHFTPNIGKPWYPPGDCTHPRVAPPSTGRLAPVMKAALDARKTMVEATSQGSDMRPSGCFAASPAIISFLPTPFSSALSSHSSVLMTPAFKKYHCA